MRKLEERARAIGERAARKRVRKIELFLQEQLPRARVEPDAAGVQISAPGLVKQWLGSPALRFLSSFLR